MNKFCDEIKEKSKLEINFFIVIGGVFICILIGYLGFLLWDKLYLPYFSEILDLQSDQIKLKTNKSGESNLIGDWGTFGDFIGGTLNPVIGLISVILLFATWFVTYRTLEVSREELKKSTAALEDNAETQKQIQKNQSLQQFDSFFFSLLSQIRDYEKEIHKDNDLDRIYEWLFVRGNPSTFDSIAELNKKYELNSYFLIVFELLKNIYERIENNTLLGDSKNIARGYVNIIKVTMPFKLQQLLMLKVCDSKDYRHYFVRYGFFDKTPFYNLQRDNGLLSLLAISLIFKYKNLYVEDENIKGIDAFAKSEYLRDLQNTSLFGPLFSLNNFQEIILNGNEIAKKILPLGKYVIAKFDDEYTTKELKINFTSETINISFLNLSYEPIKVSLSYSGVQFFNQYMIIVINDRYKLKIYLIESLIKIEQSYSDREYINAYSIEIK